MNINFFVHPSACVDNGAKIGSGTKIWHWVHVSSKAVIGANVTLGQNVFVADNVSIGDSCKVQNNVSIYDGVTIEDDVFCGPSCVFTNVNNPRSEIIRKDEYLKTLVKKGASIGANATIVCGSTLGEYCFIAAGATVTKDVPSYALMAGTPAKRIGWMSKSGGKLTDDLICPINGDRYQLKNENKIVEFKDE